MTARQVWEGMLTELSKVNASPLLLKDFNYFFNKAINQYINKRYNIYDVNQQTTDDLRVLKATAVLSPVKATNTAPLSSLSTLGAGASRLYGATYEISLPNDYLHILNCMCIYKVKKTWKCYDQNDYVQFAARRLTADSWSIVVNDYFNRPLPERPYFYIHNVNVNTGSAVPTNPLTSTNTNGTDMNGAYNVGPTTITQTYYDGDTQVYVKEGAVYSDSACNTLYSKQDVSALKVVSTQTPSASNNSNFPRTINLSDSRTVSTVERDTATRYGNASKVRMEIRYGDDDTVFELQKVLVDYIKTPQHIRLTQAQVNLTEDTSQIMEFPDYVCQEIINELTTLVMANIADPRLQTHIPVTTTIANPAQAQSNPNQQG